MGQEVAEVDETIINSCRVCRTPNQDSDFECLYAVEVIEEEDGVIHSHTWQLTETGKLYEDLIGVEIDGSTMELYPQYLCNSCDLQMRLFRKLIVKARRTLDELAKIFQAGERKNLASTCVDNGSSVREQIELEHVQQKHEHQQKKEEVDYIEQNMAVEQCSAGQMIDIEALLPTSLTTAIQAHKHHIDCKEERETTNNDHWEETKSNAEPLSSPPTQNLDQTNEVLNKLEVVALGNTSITNFTKAEDASHTKGQKCERKEIEFVSFQPSHDDSEDTMDGKQAAIAQYQQGPIEFFDEHFLEDTTSGLPVNMLERPRNAGACNGGNLRRAYECQACGLEFLRRTDFLQHRKSVHSNKFPCPYCSKLLHTNDALRVHLRLHNGEPAYKCDLCQRTFNQKVHYRYHMDRHNNVRNFKCTHCTKAFLSKHDMAVHMRSHTGERPYECDICGKGFLILQHLKMHRYSHTNKSFQCLECNQLFISPSTLRIHQQTIHTNERRFQCEFCVKRFRRKHHLISHYRVHTKPESLADSLDDFVEAVEESTSLEVVANATSTVDTTACQMTTPMTHIHDQQLVAAADDENVEGFLEINQVDEIGGMLVVDVGDGNAQAFYGADYVIDVTEGTGADMTF